DHPLGEVVDGTHECLYHPWRQHREIADAGQPVIGPQAHDDMRGAPSLLVGHFDDIRLVVGDFGHGGSPPRRSLTSPLNLTPNPFQTSWARRAYVHSPLQLAWRGRAAAR